MKEKVNLMEFILTYEQRYMNVEINSVQMYQSLSYFLGDFLP